jgi:hypothetical protein
MARGRHPHQFARDGGRKVAAALQARKESSTSTGLRPNALKVKIGKPKFDPQIAERWKAGDSIGKLAADYKMKRSQIRRAITLGVGGKDKFRELRNAGAGGTHVPFGGKRSGGRTREAIALDDSKVPVLQSKDIRLRINGKVIQHLDGLRAELNERLAAEGDTPADRMRLETGYNFAQHLVARAKTDAKYKGWSVEHYPTQLGSALRLHAPDGKTYVRAASTERADYIVTNDVGPTRWKLESEARLARVEAKHAAEVEKGTTALKATRAKKRAARQARKAGKSSSASKRRARRSPAAHATYAGSSSPRRSSWSFSERTRRRLVPGNLVASRSASLQSRPSSKGFPNSLVGSRFQRPSRSPSWMAMTKARRSRPWTTHSTLSRASRPS